MVHGAYGTKSIWEEFLYLLRDWSLRWLDADFCTDASEKGFTFAVREGCRELASEGGRVTQRTRFKRSSRSIRARSRALRSIALDVVLESSSSDEDEVALALKEGRADLPKVSLQLRDPSAWKLAASGALFREEARSILYVVRYAEGRCSLVHLLLLSDNLALVLALCKRRSNMFTDFQSCVESLRLASGQVLSYRSGGYRQSSFGIVPTREAVSLTVIVTRANHIFMFLHSAQHDLHRHPH